MNKGQFITHISEQHNFTKVKAEKTVNMFMSSVIDTLAQGNEISLVGFGNLSVAKVPARDGRNPRTVKTLKIAAYNQPKFRAGQKLKNAVN